MDPLNDEGDAMEAQNQFPPAHNGGVSWRAYGLLGPPILQTHDLCWAISLTRQFQHYLRRWGILPPDGELSIQHLVNVTPRELLELSGEVIDITELDTVMEENGFINAAQMPFTGLPNSHLHFDEEGEPMVYDDTRFPLDVVFHIPEDFYGNEYGGGIIGGMEEAWAEFYAHLRDAIDDAPVSVRMPIYDSYHSIVGQVSLCNLKY